MTAAFVVLIGSEEKVSQTEPTILGPFEDGDAAWAWVNEHQAELGRWKAGEVGLSGGWPSAHVICEATADSPEAWLQFKLDATSPVFPPPPPGPSDWTYEGPDGPNSTTVTMGGIDDSWPSPTHTHDERRA